MFKGLMDRSTELCETWVPFCPENEIHVDGIKPIMYYMYMLYIRYICYFLIKKCFGVFGRGRQGLLI